MNCLHLSIFKQLKVVMSKRLCSYALASSAIKNASCECRTSRAYNEKCWTRPATFYIVFRMIPEYESTLALRLVGYLTMGFLKKRIWSVCWTRNTSKPFTLFHHLLEPFPIACVVRRTQPRHKRIRDICGH